MQTGEDDSSYRKKGVGWALTLFGICVIVFLLVSIYYQPQPHIKEWHIVAEFDPLDPLGAEHDPGAGASGFLQIFFINHTASPATAYAFNSSATLESWCEANMPTLTPYASADEFKVELAHSTLFDIVVRCRWNQTHAHNGTEFRDTDVRVNLTLTGFNTAGGMADILGTGVVTYNVSTSEYMYTNWYWQDDNGGAGAGFTFPKGGTWSNNQITKIKFWAYY